MTRDLLTRLQLTVSRTYFTCFVILRKLMSFKCRYPNNIEFVALTQKSTSTAGRLYTKSFLSIELSFQEHVPRHANWSAIENSPSKNSRLSVTSSGPDSLTETEGGPSSTEG